MPRGSGIVTRRPLIIELLYNGSTEWGEFSHKENEKFIGFDQIQNEIEVETNRLVGSNKGISNVPIYLKFFSPHGNYNIMYMFDIKEDNYVFINVNHIWEFLNMI